MINRRWTPEENRLLKTKMTNEEIADITGRTKGAVRRHRYEMTGHHNINKDNQRPTFIEKMSKVEGECRILSLAQKMNIKLLKE